VHGFATASGVAATLLAVGAGLVAVLMNAGKPARPAAVDGAAPDDAAVVHIG
jgi:microcompartment protein CcmK/EutM